MTSRIFPLKGSDLAGVPFALPSSPWSVTRGRGVQHFQPQGNQEEGSEGLRMAEQDKTDSKAVVAFRGTAPACTA